jgi:probable HAF family extracellular repeat protein
LAQTKYVDALPSLGGLFSSAAAVNDRGWVSGSADETGDSVSHAALWLGDSVIDLGSLGGPGTNSSVNWTIRANNGLIVGISDTDAANPLGEAFSCWPFFASAAPTGRICNGFRWSKGVMTRLPPFPGGYNSYAASVNNRGEIVGWAENGVHDPTCDPAFQVLQFRAAIWEPNGVMHELPPLAGDSTSAATAINDLGQVVGISGSGDVAVGRFSARHAVIWENRVPTDLGSLGGVAWNTATAINDRGVVVGFSNLAGTTPPENRNYEAFIWTRETGMRSLGKLPGDSRSIANGINEKNQVVGTSRGGPYGTRAFLWEETVGMADLNSATPAGSLFLLTGNDINDRGDIAREAYDPNTASGPAYVARPVRNR